MEFPHPGIWKNYWAFSTCVKTNNEELFNMKILPDMFAGGTWRGLNEGSEVIVTSQSLSAHCTTCPPCSYLCSFTMCSIYMAQPPANQDRSKSPLSINHYSQCPLFLCTVQWSMFSTVITGLMTVMNLLWKRQKDLNSRLNHYCVSSIRF